MTYSEFQQQIQNGNVRLKDSSLQIAYKLGISEEEANYFVFTGEASNTTYNPADESINILFKDGRIKDISKVDNALIQHNLKGTVRKHYICYWRV